MATITELMQGRAPGEIRVRSPGWGSDAYFTPYYLAGAYWCGINNNGAHASSNNYNDDWELYTEPKRKVALYNWAVRYVDRGNSIYSSIGYFSCEEALHTGIRGITWCQRLDHTKIEVEE